MTVSPDSTDSRGHRRAIARDLNAASKAIEGLTRPSKTGTETRVVVTGTYNDPAAFFADYGLIPGHGDRINNVNWASGTPSFWQYHAPSASWKNGPLFP